MTLHSDTAPTASYLQRDILAYVLISVVFWSACAFFLTFQCFHVLWGALPDDNVTINNPQGLLLAAHGMS